MDYIKLSNGTKIEYGHITGGRKLCECDNCYDTMIEGDDIYKDDYDNKFCSQECYIKYYNKNNYGIDADELTMEVLECIC